jgi:hypothetical protein
MASAAAHEQQASRNRDFYKEIGGRNTPWPEWALAALFYAAVHEVQALIVRKNWRLQRKDGPSRFPSDHNERLRVIKRECPQIETDYRSLKQWSEDARYECRPFSPGNVQLAKAVLDRITVELAKIT